MSPAHSISPDHSLVESLPQRIGRYNVLGQLAVGGMSEILLARLVGPSGFERPVVIKRVLPQYAAQPRFVHMFLDEARIAASIRHPNVVHVEDLGHEEQLLYLIMEYLEGENVSGLLRRLVSRATQLSPELCAYIAAEACAGLHAAHERGVVHRDVSPQNIFVGYDGSVKVLDFGIAKATDRITSTEAGELKGKFAYMSPEQCLASSIGPKSDIFSLGIVLYEMLTLHRLFQRPSQLATLQAVLDDAIPHPNTTRPEITEALSNLCLKALEREPDARLDSALAFRQELQQSIRTSKELPEQRLAQLMTRLFSERLAEKQEMLRLLRSGSEVTQIPHAEADVEIELPTVATKFEASNTPPRTERTSRRWWLLTLPIGALILGALLWWVFGVDSTPAPETPQVNLEPTSTVPTKSVRIEVESTPPGAEVWIHDTLLDTTPTELRLERSDKTVGIRLSLDGYLDVLEQVTPDIDQRIRVSLLPRQQQQPPRKQGRSPREKGQSPRKASKAPTPEKEIRMFP